MILIRGKERSGTSWLERLIRENYRNNGVDAKLKHHFAQAGIEEYDHVLVISKHPLEWWYSMFCYFKKYNEVADFSAFNLAGFHSWNIFYRNWLSWKPFDNVSFIRYRDLYYDPEKVLAEIGLERNDYPFDRISNRVDPDASITKRKYQRKLEAIKYQYANNSGVLESLKKEVVPDVLKSLGYASMDLEEI